MIDPATDVTPGWRFLWIGFEGEGPSLEGLDPWKHEWHDLGFPSIVVAHPSHPRERHPMWVYEIRTDKKTIKFAAGEFSNQVWGFFLPN